MATVLSFLLTLGVLVVVHEYGHYRVARWAGVKVLRFSVGFGRVIWRHRRQADGTEFTLSALPLGGYVRMLDSREAAVAPGELARAFDQQPLRKRVAIVAAGPLANLLLATVLYAIMLWVGVAEPLPRVAAPPSSSLAAEAGLLPGDLVTAWSEDGRDDWQPVGTMSELRWIVGRSAIEHQDVRLQVRGGEGHAAQVVRLRLSRLDVQELDAGTWQRIGLVGVFQRPVLGEVVAGGPADAAGLRAADLVLAIDGQPVPDAQTLLQRIRDQVHGDPMHWTIERAGQRMDLMVRPHVAEVKGQPVGKIEAYVGEPPASTIRRAGPLEGLTEGVQRTADMAILSVRMMGRMLIGEASLRNLSGPLTIADYAGKSAQQGWTAFLGFLAVVSVSLGVLNLLPLPLLDGGLLMYYLFEGLTGRPVSEAWLRWLQRGGALVLLLMMSIALSNDMARLLGLQ